MANTKEVSSATTLWHVTCRGHIIGLVAQSIMVSSSTMSPMAKEPTLMKMGESSGDISFKVVDQD